MAQPLEELVWAETAIIFMDFQQFILQNVVKERTDNLISTVSRILHASRQREDINVIHVAVQFRSGELDFFCCNSCVLKCFLLLVFIRN